MVKEIIVLRETGIPLFHYSISGTKRLDELVAGFLSAVGFFAEQVGDEKIKVISFAKSKFVWEKVGDLYFIALVAEEDSPEIYGVILRSLAQQFVATYYSELRKEEPSPKVFVAFSDVVEATLQKFDGIPGIARRYRTALVPVETVRSLKKAQARTEEHPGVHRSAVITSDGYVVVSNFRTYELEAILDILLTFSSRSGPVKEQQIAVHTSLDSNTRYYIRRMGPVGCCVFVVDAGLGLDECERVTTPLRDEVSRTDFSKIQRIDPDESGGVLEFYPYDVLRLLRPKEEIGQEENVLFVGLPMVTVQNIRAVLRTVGENTTLDEVYEDSGLEREDVDEALAILISKGLAEVVRVFPVIADRDERFAAFLEVIGIPKRDYVVLDTIWEYCNGSHSIREISEKTRVPASRIVEVMRALGRYVEWNTERMLTTSRRVEGRP